MADRIMNDPEMELLQLLKEKWSLTGELDAGKMDFIRARRPVEQVLKPTVYTDHREGSQNPIGSSLVVLEGDYLALVGIQNKARGSSVTEIEVAKDDQWSMWEEVERILGEEALPSGWKWAYVPKFANRDDYGSAPPIVAEELTVLIKYMRS